MIHRVGLGGVSHPHVARDQAAAQFFGERVDLEPLLVAAIAMSHSPDCSQWRPVCTIVRRNLLRRRSRCVTMPGQNVSPGRNVPRYRAIAFSASRANSRPSGTGAPGFRAAPACPRIRSNAQVSTQQ